MGPEKFRSHTGGKGKGRQQRAKPSEMYQNKKLVDLQKRKERREIGIKASYKKLLRKGKPVKFQQEPADSVVKTRELPGETNESSAFKSTRVNRGENSSQEFSGGLRGRNKQSSLKKAKNIFQRRQEEREEREIERKRREEERKLAILNRKKSRLEKFKVLNQKTVKGQPVMKGRIQLLLKKIQASTN